ncbi:MAG: FtsX-like permease family protein, partial [Spirochaetia bacterium]
MFCKMLKNELSIKKVIHTSLFLFILLPALLTAGGAHMILDLNGAVENFFRQAQVPHFLQMHSGNLDREAVDRWSDEHPLVAEHQVAEMLTIDGSSIFLGPDSFSLAESVMDISFMDQNRELDFLLNLENQPADISPGGIGVPLFFMESAGLEIGDTVQVVQGDYSKRFIIEAFVRDALMNPSIIHSKRFVIHSSDYRELKTNIGTVEYLLEYQLPDQSYIQEFSADFEEAGMPASGPALTYSMFYLMNVVTEGINITIVLFVSLLFCLVAVLCLRFTILAAMEEDYREIGVMKAIGLPPKYIRRMYLLKYAVMAAAASAAGSAAAFFLSTYFSSSILLYMGESPSGWQNIVFPALASLVIFFIVTGSCMLVLRRIGRISAVQALQSAGTTADAGNKGFLPLRKFQGMGVNAVLALQDVIQRFRMYWLLGFVFFVCSFIVLVPLNFLNTIEDPSFITYLGIGRS